MSHFFVISGETDMKVNIDPASCELLIILKDAGNDVMWTKWGTKTK